MLDGPQSSQPFKWETINYVITKGNIVKVSLPDELTS